MVYIHVHSGVGLILKLLGMGTSAYKYISSFNQNYSWIYQCHWILV